MVNRKLTISKAKASKLQASSGSTVKKKPAQAEKPQPPAPEILEAKQLAEEAKLQAGAAAEQALQVQDLMQEQLRQMQALIERIPTPDHAPPITGFQFIRDSDNIATGIKFIRGTKKVLN